MASGNAVTRRRVAEGGESSQIVSDKATHHSCFAPTDCRGGSIGNSLAPRRQKVSPGACRTLYYPSTSCPLDHLPAPFREDPPAQHLEVPAGPGDLARAHAGQAGGPVRRSLRRGARGLRLRLPHHRARAHALQAVLARADGAAPHPLLRQPALPAEGRSSRPFAPSWMPARRASGASGCMESARSLASSYSLGLDTEACRLLLSSPAADPRHRRPAGPAVAHRDVLLRPCRRASSAAPAATGARQAGATAGSRTQARNTTAAARSTAARPFVPPRRLSSFDPQPAGAAPAGPARARPALHSRIERLGVRPGRARRPAHEPGAPRSPPAMAATTPSTCLPSRQACATAAQISRHRSRAGSGWQRGRQ